MAESSLQGDKEIINRRKQILKNCNWQLNKIITKSEADKSFEFNHH